MCREELIDFEKYIIQKDGTIYSKHWEKPLKGWVDEDGYLVNCLMLKNGKRQPYRTNRVIAYLYCEKPEHLKDIPYNELQTGHMDTNRINNNYLNLYWCTSKENNNNPKTKQKQIGKSSWNKGLKGCFSDETLKSMSEKRRIPIIQYSVDDVFIKEWTSTIEASKELGIKSSNITACLKNYPNHKSAGGFKWKYA